MADVDQLWAILSADEHRGKRWDREEFFRTGEAEVARLLDVAAEAGFGGSFGRALDFGCGVGRLCRALAAHARYCIGVDVSWRMASSARRFTAGKRCAFVVADRPDLAYFASSSFDLVTCLLVLQHVRARRAVVSYVGEFMRVVRRGGLVIFQLPTPLPWYHRLQPKRRVYRLLRKIGVSHSVLYSRFGLTPISMRGLREAVVRSVVEEHGGQIVRMLREPLDYAQSMIYFVTVS